MSRQVKCPRCGKKKSFEGNEFRPFCSERCKVSDLGAWAEEAYFIPGEDVGFEEDLDFLGGEESCKETYH